MRETYYIVSINNRKRALFTRILNGKYFLGDSKAIVYYIDSEPALTITGLEYHLTKTLQNGGVYF